MQARFNLKFEEKKSELKEAITQAKCIEVFVIVKLPKIL